MNDLGGFLEHLKELQKRLVRIAITLGVFFIICVTFEIKTFKFFGYVAPYIYPNVFNAIAIQFFNWLLASLAPSYVVPVVLSPLEGIIVEMKTALFLSIALSMPVIIYQLGKFVAPGLKPKEKKLLLKITAPATILFISGAVFAYIFILPFVFDFLYQIGIAMIRTNQGFQAFLSVDQFIDFTLMFLLSFGLAFELPIVMVGLTALGVVEPDFWKRNWRFAVAAIFIFGAVITPDGSGVTMMMVSLPMLLLYLIGYWISKRYRKSNKEGSV